MTVDTARLASDFEKLYGRSPDLVAEAPGRVNLIGEHTDYNEGFVLPMAIDRTIAVVAAARDDDTLHAYSRDYEQHDEFALARVRRFAGSRGWRDYVRGVIWALLDDNFELRGADLMIAGDVPQGGGLSSSAAIEMAVAGALTSLAGCNARPRQLAQVCQKAENIAVGVQCGIMDQLTSGMGQAGHALLIDCRSLAIDPVPLPDQYAIFVIDSKVPRSLANTPYNTRREECAGAAFDLGVSSLRDAEMDMLESRRGLMPEALFRRAHHVITENERVLAMAGALADGNAHLVGELMSASQESMRDDFEMSVPAIDTLVEVALDAGAIGARLTGGGFGGCTVNIVATDNVASFVETTLVRYREKTGLDAEAHVCSAVDGLSVARA
jgi:galactokinase